MSHIVINGREVGDGRPAYIIAEIGANHNGDMSLARELISAAKDCGCDAVKFQLWGRRTIHVESYIQAISPDRKPGDKSTALGLGEELEKYQCNREQHAELKDYADKIGIDFSSTALTAPDVDFLVELGVPFLKIASQDTDNPHFIRHIAEKGLPTILSTGLSSWAEIDSAVEAFKPGNLANLCLMHVIALYPPADNLIHLKKMGTMRQTFGVPIGYSDHSIGFAVPLAAVALGAVAIEKHFTLDKNLPGWDHKVSADPADMRIICSESKRITAALGSTNPELSDDEKQKAEHFRRSVVTTQAIKKGDVLSMDKLTFKRPGVGIKANEIRYVANRVAKNDIAADEIIKWDDLV